MIINEVRIFINTFRSRIPLARRIFIGNGFHVSTAGISKVVGKGNRSHLTVFTVREVHVVDKIFDGSILG